MADDAKQSLQTYRGNCHCGAFVYEIDVPEIKSVTDCNCSICFKKGSLWIFLERKNFRVVKGDIAQLTAYSFGCKRQEHQVTPFLICFLWDDFMKSDKLGSVLPELRHGTHEKLPDG